TINAASPSYTAAWHRLQFYLSYAGYQWLDQSRQYPSLLLLSIVLHNQFLVIRSCCPFRLVQWLDIQGQMPDQAHPYQGTNKYMMFAWINVIIPSPGWKVMIGEAHPASYTLGFHCP